MKVEPKNTDSDSVFRGDKLRRNQKTSAILGLLGLTAADVEMFDDFANQNWSVFLHGSAVKGQARAKSDVDFTIVGDDFGRLEQFFAPEIAGAQIQDFDYISTVRFSQNGRKISLHASPVDFRATYPQIDKPYATEYRSAAHAKSGERKYFLPSANKDGDIRLINFGCESQVLASGATLTNTPQTGRLILRGNQIFSRGNETRNLGIGMQAVDVIRLKSDGNCDYAVGNSDAEELFVLGLEEDKMRCPELSLFDDANSATKFVADPLLRAEQSLCGFLNCGQNRGKLTVKNLYAELAKYWSRIKPGKIR